MSKENLVIDKFYLVLIRDTIVVARFCGYSNRTTPYQPPYTSNKTGARDEYCRFIMNKIVYFIKERDIIRESTALDEVLYEKKGKK
jgi:hypothetical protein